ncbi:MAG: sulfatase-like hydrolase/transferase [Fuerstiella sp.]|nr:sulfatase-like hydrolase/transferase [Fuerstiella sp.]MCP4788055.1 sulfatase-like hydrolase/transferase [Fuerstiella sp.]MCP4855346.1 sulfatase-like hydrolase/transferase [Fuerstiella sp.]
MLFCSISAATDKPNIIVIYTDDHGYSDMACQGIQEDLKTPNIDALAAGGVLMTSGYVTAPQCVPSRAGLLSGRSQNRFGVESNGLPLDGFNAQQTIAERLKTAGYATGMTGKWHLGPANEIASHGFDDVYQKNANRPGWANFDLDGSNREPGTENSKLYHLDANSAAASAFITRHHDKPFFFYCAYRAPHVPLDAPPKYLKRFPGKMPERRRQALAMISAMDDGIGNILSTLRKHNLEENTLIFFIGDNGAPLKIHKLDAPGGGPGWDGSLNEPLNGEKGMLSEGGIRVPFVVYWRDRIAGGQVYDHPVISLDVAATAVALAGLPDDPQLDGVNLVPYLTGKNKNAPHDTLYWRWIAQAATRAGKWKFLRGGARDYLYDLDNDREEKNNLVHDHPEIAANLKQQLNAWAAELQPAGLQTGSMSETWETYYDFYLDGKPAAVRSTKPAANGSGESSAATDWIARNSTMNIGQDSLEVRPKGPKKRQPFIVTSDLLLPAELTAIVRLRSVDAGTAGFAWREPGQKTFANDQTVTFDCPKSNEFQTHRVNIAAHGHVIHVRMLLPADGADIESIEFQDTNGKALKKWKFGT